MRKGEIWLINLDPTVGAEIRKTRPAVIVSEDAIGLLPLRVIVPLTDWKDRYAARRGWSHSPPMRKMDWRRLLLPMPFRSGQSHKSVLFSAWANSVVTRSAKSLRLSKS